MHEILQSILADQSNGDLMVVDFPGLTVFVSVISSSKNLINPKSPEQV